MENENRMHTSTGPLQRVMITAGGTGGHIFPGLAVAQLLIQQGVSVDWVGTDYGLEKTLVPKANIPLHFLPVRGLRGKGLRRYLSLPVMMARSVSQALQLISQIQPQLVFSLGGYASGPLAIAARLKGIPLVIHEQNAAPGLTNKVLAPFARLILAGLPNQLSRFKHYRLVGNPVRADFTALHERRLLQFEAADEQTRAEVRVLVVGGSQGAEKLNSAVPVALARLAEHIPELKLHIVHQAGPTKVETTLERYQPVPVKAEVVDFIDDICGAYQWADILIGRAGALTVAEVAAAGVACIFVPLAIAVDDHQTKNAQTLINRDAAAMVAEQALASDELFNALQQLVVDKDFRNTMAFNALKSARISATEEIYRFLLLAAGGARPDSETTAY